MAIYDFFLSRNASPVTANTYIGHEGRLFYDDTNGVVKLSDGVTPGGLSIPYTIATPTVIGGIKAGSGANVSVDGTLTIDTTGLPLSIGNLQIANTTILTANANDDLILASNGTGNVNVVGDFKVYKTDGDITLRDPEFSISSDGQVMIRVPEIDSLGGAVQIVGTESLQSVAPAVSGVMLHITGHNDDFATVYTDGVNNFSNYIGRRYNGLASAPTAVLVGNTICRFSGTGYGTTEFPAGAAASIGIVALEDFTDTAQGAKIEFLAAPVGGLVRQVVANVDVANGLTVTKATVQGNLTVNGSFISNLTLSGSNVVSNNFNKNGGNVTANGRTGQITSLADSIAKGAAVTFTVNNSYVLTDKDVVIVNIASGATVGAYSATVTDVDQGLFAVTVTNNGNGSLAEALTFNFAIIGVV